MIVNGEPVEVIETIGGVSASAFAESESVEVNRESLSVIFGDSTTIVNGEIVQIYEERSTVIIDGEYVPLVFDRENVIVNVVVCEARLSVAVVNGESGE